MRPLVLLPVLMFLALSLSPGKAPACQCQPTYDPAIEYAQVDAVFMGLVIAISPSSSPNFLDVQVVVTGYWKGAVLPLMHVYTGWFDGSCGYGFDLYETYLIYAMNSMEECCPGVFTSICNRTAPLSSAQTDLNYLGPPLSVPVEGTTWGAIKEFYRD